MVKYDFAEHSCRMFAKGFLALSFKLNSNFDGVTE